MINKIRNIVWLFIGPDKPATTITAVAPVEPNWRLINKINRISKF